MESNFSDIDWTGEFFLPNKLDNKFFGKVSFSPEKGVILSYQITGHELPSESDMLHGVLDTGEPCTLIGKFSPLNSGFSIKNGLGTRNGKNGFYFLVVGILLDEGEVFSEVSFFLTGMQEFLFPKGRKDLVNYSNKPLFSVKTHYGQIEVVNNANFSFLGNDITTQIYNKNNEALTDLKRAFEEINRRYDDSFFMLRKDISYMITIKTTTKSEISTLYKYITEISDLFALLTYGPVYPELIKLWHIDNNSNRFMSTIYSSMCLERRTSDLCKRNHSHFDMPITESKIDLASSITSWLEQSEKYSTIVSSLQNETGLRSEHSVHGELVMYATQLESISHTNKVDNSNKYEYPVNKFGTDKVKSTLVRIFESVGEKDFGKGIGCLRNEIAHVGKPKKLLPSLSMRDMVNISHLLRLTIIGYVLNAIGIDKGVIADYQDKLLFRWSII